MVHGTFYIRGIVYLVFQMLFIYLLYDATRRGWIHHRFILCYTALLESIYVVWRAVFTLVFTNIAGFIASVMLLSAEFIGYIQQMIFYTLMSRLRPDNRRSRIDSLEYCPTVDVFVATYNESVSILKRTLTACTYLDYPKDKLHVYVLDDGGRDGVRTLAEELGIHYIARTDHGHAKAGNLNHALGLTSGELVVTLDADMVPKSFFLRRTVGYFKKRMIGFVQAPQIFFNPDPFQHNLASQTEINNEQDFFMIEMQSARNSFHATMYVGSNAIFSRKALESIGGFPTGTITEDVATSLLLHSKGYKGKFVKDILAKGLSAESFHELVAQRDRWCRGNLQAAKKWNPLTTHGLSIMQRLIYFSGVLYWFFGVQKLIYVISPVLYLSFGIKSIQANFFILLLLWLPRYTSNMLSFKLLSQHRKSVYWSHIYETALTPALAQSALSEVLGLHKKTAKLFRVTHKGVISNQVNVDWHMFISHCLLFVFCMTGFVAQAMAVWNSHQLDSYDFINDFWNFYNLGAIVLSVFVSIEQPRYRRSERFSVKIPCVVHCDKAKHEGWVVDLSETGMKIQLGTSQAIFSGLCDVSLSEMKSGPIRAQFVPKNSHVKRERFNYSFNWVHLTQDEYSEIVKLVFDAQEDISSQYRLHKGYSFFRTFQRSWRMKSGVLSQHVPHVPRDHGPRRLFYSDLIEAKHNEREGGSRCSSFIT